MGIFENIISAPQVTDVSDFRRWVRTGDEVEFDAEGNIYVVDRLKVGHSLSRWEESLTHRPRLQELIKVRGFQVAPAELEGHLLSHPDVADVCVIPVQDDFSGELPLAYIVLHPPAAVRAASSTAEADAIKADLCKVRLRRISYNVF